MKAQVMRFGKDVDTDQIIGSQYLLLSDIDAMKQYAFATLRASFTKDVGEKQIIVAEENFGCGSSREQAPAVLKALGVQCVVAKSFARIFYRNAINIGLPVVICEETDEIQEGMRIVVEMDKGQIEVLETNKIYACTKLPEQMQQILNAGGLLALLERSKAQLSRAEISNFPKVD